jgi:predicted acylesterase/phospholipase RssA
LPGRSVLGGRRLLSAAAPAPPVVFFRSVQTGGKVDKNAATRSKRDATRPGRDKVKRAIALGGGGPAAGLHIGVLKGLQEAGKLNFDVWALSCIGAWVGVVYNQAESKDPVQETAEFFRDHVFRDDFMYSSFPINRVFAPDTVAWFAATLGFLFSPGSYREFLPQSLMKLMAEAIKETGSYLFEPAKWFSEGDFNSWLLNGVLATNPYFRFAMSLAFHSNLDGLSRIYYPDSSFLKTIDFERLKGKDMPFIYYNAWNLSKNKLQLFANHPNDIVPADPDNSYEPVSAASLCACSALPYFLQTVRIGPDRYSEGALIDTVNFKQLVQDHKVDEVWVSRIVDSKQIRSPRNIVEASANLCQMFAAEVGANDVKLFKYHLQEDRRTVKVIEIEVSSAVSYEWNHSNFDKSIRLGAAAVRKVLEDMESADTMQANAPR